MIMSDYIILWQLAKTSSRLTKRLTNYSLVKYLWLHLQYSLLNEWRLSRKNLVKCYLEYKTNN